VRLVELLAGLSRLADLGFGLPAGESLRSAALAAVLGRRLDLSDDDVRAGLYTALLFHVGCVGYAHETAARFGDEFIVNVAGERANVADPRSVFGTLIPHLVRGRPPMQGARVAVTAVTQGARFADAYHTAACEVGRDAARRLGLPAGVQEAVYHAKEWWNGRGVPDRLAGEEIPAGARLAVLAATAALLDTLGGPALVSDALRKRGGGILDPQMAGYVADRAETLLGALDATDPYDAVLEHEPGPVVSVLAPDLVEVAAVFGDLADLKTPYLHGHSRGVGDLARDAGQRLRLGRVVGQLEVAGLLHDVGRVAISSQVWEKPGRLNTHEWEQVRLHPYHSERILAGSKRLAPLAQLVGAHHERDDGGGYHRGTEGGELSMAARVLAAADAFQAMTQRRPHRRALTAEHAEQQLLDDARAGRRDTDAVAAVLAAAGRDVVVRRELPAGLTDREVEVLELVARGCSNAGIAERLVISPRTAEYHVQQIYRKIGVSSRAAAALFAMEHRLIQD
jgi:HD-GYP domain-containing protein (c-di-GMP phosphodiesterase class II)